MQHAVRISCFVTDIHVELVFVNYRSLLAAHLGVNGAIDAPPRIIGSRC